MLYYLGDTRVGKVEEQQDTTAVEVAVENWDWCREVAAEC